MNRAIGIILILTGIGVWVATGYLFPTTVHRIDLATGTAVQVHDISGWPGWPYVGIGICMVGFIFLLNSGIKTQKSS